MTMFDRMRAEFIDIIEWRDQSSEVLVQRFDRFEHEIKMGAQLVVRPGQRAVFVNEGEVADVFEPGTYTLETQNMPILATLKGWKYGFHSPFKAEVYFINTTLLLDRKWGTSSPVMLRDADMGVIRLRARGNYAYQVGTTKEMISRFVGARDQFLAADMEGQLRTRIISSFSDCLGESKIPALDLLAQYDEISEMMQQKLTGIFENLGLKLHAFILENISVPEAVEKAMDQRSSMGALGNLNQFSQYQAANALRDAANNEGGMAGGMMGMMVGGGLGGNMGGVLTQDQTTAATENSVACGKCGQTNDASAKFCSGCGQALPSAPTDKQPCIKCQQPIAAGSKFCSHCGAAQSAACTKCGAELSAGAKFCGECGSRQ